MVFFLLRQQASTIQALIQVEPELVSKKMVRWTESVNSESIVLVTGTVQKPLEPVKSCTVQDAEIKIKTVSYPPSMWFCHSTAPLRHRHLA